MGCGESKHAVATQNTITKSKSKSRSIRKQAEIPKNDVHVASNAVKDSEILKKNENQGVEVPKNIESEAVKAKDEEVKVEKNKEIEVAAAVAKVVEVEEKKKEEIIKNEELKEEKKEEVKPDVVEKESPAAIEVVQEIKNEELKEEKKEEVKPDAVEQGIPAAIEVVQEIKEEEIKNVELKEDKKDEVKADQEEVVSQQVEDASSSSSSANEKIPQGENVTVEGESNVAVAVAAEEGNAGKEEGLKVEESKELALEIKPSAEEEKKPADQNEAEVVVAAAPADVKGN